MQCRKAIRTSWGLSPKICKWIYTAVVRPILTYACTVWVKALDTQRNCKLLEKVHRLALNTISGAFPNTPTISLNKLTDTPHIINYIKGEAAKGASRLQATNSWSVEGPRLAKPIIKTHTSINNSYLSDLTLPTGNNIKLRDLTKPIHMVDKNFVTTIDGRDATHRNIANLPSTTVTAYTDGSKDSDGVGFGYIITTDNNQDTIKEYSGRLPDYCTVYQSELTAITSASRALMNYTEAAIQIYTDSSSSINTINNPFTNSKTVYECFKALTTLAQNNRVTVSWVPGHENVWGNEKADSLAKAGIHSTNLHKGYLPQSFIKGAIDHKVKALDELRWSSHGTKHTLLTLNSHQNHIKELNSTLIKNRKQYSTAIRTMTGFIGLNYHLHKIKLSTTDCCPRCGASPETVNHFLGQCPAFTTIRGECLGAFYTNISDIFEQHSLTSILKYITRTKRLQFDPSRAKSGVT